MAEAAPSIRYEIHLKNVDSELQNGPGYSTQPAHSDQNPRSLRLNDQLEAIPRDARRLLINHDVPTDEEWAHLGSYLTSVEDLELDAGFNESLNDGPIPAHWHLKRLVLGSSCAEVIQNSSILLGQIPHLVFLLCHGLRWEGPTSQVLMQAHDEAVKSGDKGPHMVTESGVKVTYLPTLVLDWMRTKYEGQDLTCGDAEIKVNLDLNVEPEAIIPTKDPKAGLLKLTKLELLDNDAIEMFIRFSMALPHLAYNLRTLNIRSTNCCDMDDMPDDLFIPMLSSNNQLETLVLSIGEVFDPDGEGKTPLLNLYDAFPENITTLRFRGPASLTQTLEWNDWVTKFEDPAFLPKLKKLSFVCDLAYQPPKGSGFPKEIRQLSEDELIAARGECNRLLDAVARRGGNDAVSIEPFVEKWHERFAYFQPVDARWYTA